jgi:WD40 repeat protein
VTKPIFISYSSQDIDFAVKLADGLQAQGFKYWIDRKITGGEEWRRLIEEQLRAADEVIVILSENSIKSKWVQYEGAKAQAWGKKIYPVLIDDEAENDLPLWTDKIQFIDFRKDFEVAFEALADALTPPNPIQDLLDQQVQAYQQTGELLGDSLLGYIEENLDKVSFDETAKELFVISQNRRDEAQREMERNQRWRQRANVLLSILTVAAIILSIFSFNQTQNLRDSQEAEATARADAEERAEEAEEARVEAEEARVEAEEARVEAEAQASLAIAGELAAVASSMIDSNPELGMLLAVESLREQYTIQGEEVLRQLLITSRLKTIVTAHQGQPVNVVEYSPDGENILTAGEDNVARIWDATTGVLLLDLAGHAAPISRASFSEDGGSVITIGDDETIRIWDAKSGEEEVVLVGSPASISQSGKFVIGVDASNNSTRVWDVEAHQVLRSIDNPGEISSVAINPEGKYAVVVDSENIGAIWDVELGALVGSIEGEVLAFSPDGRKAITHTGGATLWDITNGEKISTLVTEGIPYWLGASFSEDGEWIITWPIDILHKNKNAQIWDANSGELFATLRGHDSDVLTAAFDPGGRYAITGSIDNTLRVWTFRGAIILELNGHVEDVVSISVRPDGKSIASASSDGTMRTWDISTSKSEIIGDAITAMFGPENTLALNSAEGNVTIYSIDQDGFSKLDHYENAICRDGRWVAKTTNDSTIQVIEASTGEVIGLVEAFDEISSIPIISPNGKYLIVNKQVWAIETGESISDLNNLEGDLPSVASVGIFSPDDELIVAQDSENILHIWELATGTSAVQMIGHTDGIIRAEFSPDGVLLATASLDGSARVWDVVSGQAISVIETQALDIFAVSFSPDSQYILVGDFNGKVQLFDAQTGTLVRNFVGQTGPIISAAFSPNGKYIITTTGEFGMADNTARIWEVNSGLMLYKHVGFITGLNNAGFSEDGKWAVVVDDGKARLLNCEVCVSYEDLMQLAEERLTNMNRALTCQEEEKYFHKDVECNN